MTVSSDIPTRLAEIVDDFQFAEGREKLELLLQFSENLPLCRRSMLEKLLKWKQCLNA